MDLSTSVLERSKNHYNIGKNFLEEANALLQEEGFIGSVRYSLSRSISHLLKSYLIYHCLDFSKQDPMPYHLLNYAVAIDPTFKAFSHMIYALDSYYLENHLPYDVLLDYDREKITTHLYRAVELLEKIEQELLFSS